MDANVNSALRGSTSTQAQEKSVSRSSLNPSDFNEVHFWGSGVLDVSIDESQFMPEVEKIATISPVVDAPLQDGHNATPTPAVDDIKAALMATRLVDEILVAAQAEIISENVAAAASDTAVVEEKDKEEKEAGTDDGLSVASTVFEPVESGGRYDTRESVLEFTERIASADPGAVGALRLSGSTFGLPAVEAIANAIAKRPELTRAHLDDMFTGRLTDELYPSLSALSCSLLQCPCLVELDLSDNAVSVGGSSSLFPLLARASSLRVLRLNNTGVGSQGGRAVGAALQTAAMAGMRLHTFVLGRSRLEAPGATAIACALEKMGSLVEVRMPQNGIRGAGIPSLAASLKANIQLEILDLNDNTFGAHGAMAMADALRSLVSLRHVDFGDCLCRRRGGAAILSALTGSRAPLEVLNLEYNELDDAAVADGIISLLQNGQTSWSEGGLCLDGNTLSKTLLSRIGAALAVIDKVAALGSVDEMESCDEEELEEEEEEESDGSASESESEGEDPEDTAAVEAEIARLVSAL
eukprot:UC1_evm1s1788